MPLTLEEIAAKAVAAVAPEQRANTAVYLDTKPAAAGQAVELGGETVAPASESYIAFIDPQPAANWGHPCRYLLIPVDGGAAQSVECAFPPFIAGASPTLRLIFKGDRVPDWTLAVR